MSSAWPLRPRRLVRKPCGLLLAPHVPLPGKKTELPPSSSSTDVATDSRNQRSCATRTTAASIVASSCSSHSIEAMSRWLVGSSRRSRSGPAGERSCQRGARQLSAGEGVEPAVEIGVREAEAAQHGGGVVAPAVAARVLEPCLGLAVAPQGLRAVIARGHRFLEPAQLALGLDQVGRARERVFAQREAAEPGRPLVVERDAGALLPGELAACELGLAHQGTQQRRLAGAVRAGEREPVAALELERDPVEEGLAGELLAERGCDQNRHAPRVVRVGGALAAGRGISLRL